jgi:pimeloyl-ACP methyl ester carboxylesterase
MAGPGRRLAVAAAAGVALIGAVAAAAVATRRRVGGPPLTFETGMFANTMAWGRVGVGERSIIVIPGGPGNSPPSERWMRSFGAWYRPFVEAGYSVWQVTRKRGMPRGHSMDDIATDYAELIATEFDGLVEAVVGVSYGGAVGFHLAARHPERVGRMVILAASARVDDEGRAADLEFARHIEAGRPGAAMATLAPFIAPGIPKPVVGALSAVVGPMAFRDTHETFRSDTVVEAEAEAAFDATELLPTIAVPVLYVVGDRDAYFPIERCDATARLIPDVTYRVHAGKGHREIAGDAAIAAEVVAWLTTADRAPD